MRTWRTLRPTERTTVNQAFEILAATAPSGEMLAAVLVFKARYEAMRGEGEESGDKEGC